jgi:hypothetical protein
MQANIFLPIEFELKKKKISLWEGGRRIYLLEMGFTKSKKRKTI